MSAVAGHEPTDLAPPGLALLPLDLRAPQLRRSSCTTPSITSVGQARAAVDHLGDRPDDLLGGRALHQIADGSGAEHLEHGGLVLERRQRDHARLGERRLISRAARGPPPAGMLDVHERDVGTSALASSIASSASPAAPTSTRSSSCAISSASASRSDGLVVGDETRIVRTPSVGEGVSTRDTARTVPARLTPLQLTPSESPRRPIPPYVWPPRAVTHPVRGSRHPGRCIGRRGVSSPGQEVSMSPREIRAPRGHRSCRADRGRRRRRCAC